MARALELAAGSFGDGGCPIGAVLVDHETGRAIGEGHNGLVQEGNPIVHGEMAALRNAGRMRNRHNTTMYTTLQPCFMCAGAIVQFGIPRVVIADAENALGPRQSASCATGASTLSFWILVAARQRGTA